jgi:EXPERA (EXPanded EBP superfamily)
MTSQHQLPLSERKFDYFFIVMFSIFFITSMISDMLPTIYGDLVPNHPNPLMKANYDYANGCDPLFLHPPVWMRFVTGLSAFVYGPFYLVLVYAFIKGKNWIQLPAVIYGTMISVITGVIVFGVEFFGEAEWRCQDPAKFLPLNLPYVIIPILLIVRMRRELPFNRRF